MNACNTVTCLINIMGLILPGLSSAYVGERGKAHSRAGAQAGSASRESKLHVLHHLPSLVYTFPDPSSLAAAIGEATKSTAGDGSL